MKNRGIGAVAIVIAVVAVAAVVGLGYYFIVVRGGGAGGNMMVMTHGGVDFSAGVGNCETENIPYESHDGDVINWSPFYYGDSQYTQWGESLWFRPAGGSASDYQIKDMGAVSLDSITTVPGSWDTGDIAPLTVGHAYVVQCKDGCAKFYVTALEGDSPGTAKVTVQYAFSTTANF